MENLELHNYETGETDPEVKIVNELPSKADRVKWFFNMEARLVTCTIGITVKEFDLSSIIPMTATVNEKALMYYGFKQWVASNWASVGKTDEAKWVSAQADYDGLIKSGLELAEGKSGQTFMRIIGKVSKKADPDTAKVSKTHLNAQVWSLLELKTLQKAGVPFTPEMMKVFLELEAEALKQEEINKTLKKRGLK